MLCFLTIPLVLSHVIIDMENLLFNMLFNDWLPDILLYLLLKNHVLWVYIVVFSENNVYCYLKVIFMTNSNVVTDNMPPCPILLIIQDWMYPSFCWAG